MNVQEKESAAMKYEIFIRRAFKCDYDKHGAKNEYFKILADTAPNYVGSFPPSFTKQLATVKSNLTKATDRFLTKFKLNAEEKEKLLEIRERIQNANSAEIIKYIVFDGVEITQRFKDF